MTIGETAWAAYLDRMRRINEAAASQMEEWISRNGTEDEEAMIDYAFALATKYGEASAAMAAEMYDAVAEFSGVSLPAAVPAETASYAETAKAVMGTRKIGSEEIIADAVGRMVKMAGVDTTMRNAYRDHAEWAWIPAGDTCAFCLTLASLGWQPASKDAMRGGHAEHIHANCDCTYAVRFDRRSNVSGYNPEKLKSQYYSSGDTPEERINAIRRRLYAENREEINAQKRAAYARRTGKEENT